MRFEELHKAWPAETRLHVFVSGTSIIRVLDPAEVPDYPDNLGATHVAWEFAPARRHR